MVFSDGKTEFLAKIINKSSSLAIKNILVVGCGSGIEAAILAQEFKAKVIGIDVKCNFNREVLKFVQLEIGDATNLQFTENYFDMVFSYHSLEHIPNYKKALSEINRVLKKEGLCFFGVPNKSRLVGYLGSKSASWLNKILWNLLDYKARLFGKFENKFGAHAGYASQELENVFNVYFKNVFNMSHEYYIAIYKNHKKLVNLLFKCNLSKYIFPCIYFIGKKI